MSDPASRAKAWPLADAELNDQVRFSSVPPARRAAHTPAGCRPAQILDLVEKATQYKQLKKGANEGACAPCAARN